MPHADDSAPRCPACRSPLPHVASTAGEPEKTVELRCPECSFKVAFVGPGLHVAEAPARNQ